MLGEHDAQPAGEDDEAGTDVVGSALAAASSSFVAFAGGAAIPILPFLVASGITASAAASVLVGAALFATPGRPPGSHGGPLLRWGLRQLGIGAAAAVVAYALGCVFGASVG